MPDNFDSFNRTKVDVGKIPNYLILARNKKARKDYPVIFHILYALAAALCIYFAVDGACLGLSVLNIAGLCLGPALLVYTLLYSPVWIKASAVALPALIYLVRHLLFAGSLDFLHEASHCLIYFLCILVSASLEKTSISGYSKSKCFVLVTVAYSAIILSSLAILVAFYKGSLTITAIKEALDGFFSRIVDSSVQSFSDPQFFDSMRAALPAAKDLSDSEMLSAVTEAFEISASYVKTILPSILVITAMFFAAITVEVFSHVARRMNVDLFVCIMDDVWTYRPSTVTMAFFDILFFVYIIGSFVSYPVNVAITVENLINIMTPVMFVLGSKAIYKHILKKNNSKGKSILVCAVLFVLVLGFTGSLGMLIIGSFGVSFITRRDREEAEMLPKKMLSQKEECEKLFPKENKDEQDVSDQEK